VTGYLPITKAAYAATKASGFYDKNPGREIPIIQMTAKPPTENSRGLRLGNLVQIRDIIAEDLEAAFVGKEDAQPAVDVQSSAAMVCCGSSNGISSSNVQQPRRSPAPGCVNCISYVPGRHPNSLKGRGAEHFARRQHVMRS
jgi:hypothetical protein